MQASIPLERKEKQKKKRKTTEKQLEQCSSEKQKNVFTTSAK